MRARTAICLFSIAGIVPVAQAETAHAACPIELAVYRDREGVAEISFSPLEVRAVATNQFRLLMPDTPPFDGLVMWTENPARAGGLVMYDCPEGDVTGAEIAACTVWQGAIYAIDGDGEVRHMPREGEPAPARLLFADLGYQMVGAAAFDTLSLPRLPWDAFELSGCQE